MAKELPVAAAPTKGGCKAQGNEYLRESFPKLDYIKSAKIIK